jgi:NTP pyrophosphatase (non-canonical NTP hydrolase)
MQHYDNMTEIETNVHGKVEEWSRDLDTNPSPLPWKVYDLGNIRDALNRILFTPELSSISRGWTEENLHNANLIVEIVNQQGRPDSGISLQTLQDEITKWANVEFPDRKPESAIMKMYSELGEAIDDPHNRLEWADVFILVLDIVKLFDIQGDEMTEAILKKLAINYSRKWKANDLGIMCHMDEEIPHES